MNIVIKVRMMPRFYACDDWSCEIEIERNTSLEDLHYEIQKIIEFDNKQPYLFFLSCREFGSTKTSFDDGYSLTAQVSSLFPLPKNRKLFYHFDFSDDWIFQITKSRKKPRLPMKDLSYPIVILESGTKPGQHSEIRFSKRNHISCKNMSLNGYADRIVLILKGASMEGYSSIWKAFCDDYKVSQKLNKSNQDLLQSILEYDIQQLEEKELMNLWLYTMDCDCHEGSYFGETPEYDGDKKSDIKDEVLTLVIGDINCFS